MTKATPALIAEIALDIAAEHGWTAVSAGAISRRGEIPMTELYRYRSPRLIQDTIEARFDLACASEEIERDMSVRERIFDVAMLRFEAMEDKRAGVMAIRKHWKIRPRARLAAAKRRVKTAQWVLSCAESEARRLEFLSALGLSTILFRAEEAWERDEGRDFTQTMAQLDRDLRDADQWMARLSETKARWSRQSQEEKTNPDGDIVSA